MIVQEAETGGQPSDATGAPSVLGEPKAEEPKAEEPKAEEPKAEQPEGKEPEAQEPKKPKLLGEEPELSPIELKKPEQFHLDDGSVDEIAAFARERGLSTEQAQALLERENDQIEKYREKFEQNQVQTFLVQAEEWAKSVEQDPKLGGANLVHTLENSRRALARFPSGAEFQEALQQSGFWNHPVVQRYLSDVGQSLRGDSLVSGTAQKPKRDLAPYQKLYGPKDGD